jgi:acyl dehydratase
LLALPGLGPENCNKSDDKTCSAVRFCDFLALQQLGLQACSYANFLRQRDFMETEFHVIKSIEDAKALENVEVGVSDWIVIDQQMINRFAEATDDYQWIHVDEERAARELPDGKTIAHGYMTLSLIPTLTKDFVHVENLARAINFGCYKVRFYTAVPVGARVRARATVLQARKRGGALHLLSEIKVDVEGGRTPACVAETIGMYFFEEETADAAAESIAKTA